MSGGAAAVGVGTLLALLVTGEAEPLLFWASLTAGIGGGLVAHFRDHRDVRRARVGIAAGALVVAGSLAVGYFGSEADERRPTLVEAASEAAEPPAAQATPADGAGTAAEQDLDGWYGNARFGFSFPYPVTWTGAEPQNGGGISLADPDPDAPARISASGSHNAMGLLDPADDVAVLDERIVSLPVWEWADETQVRLGYSVYGVRRVERADAETCIVQQAEVGEADGAGRVVTISLCAANAVFDDYRPLFDRILAEYKVEAEWWG